MDGFYLKKTLDDIMTQAYPKEVQASLRKFKHYYVQISDKTYRSKHGDYNLRTHRIRLFNITDRDSVLTVATAIHELAHHVDWCLRGRTDHQSPFYEVYRKLLYAGIDMGLFDAKTFLSCIRDASDHNKVRKIISGYEKKETGYKKNMKRIDVKDAYEKKDALKEAGYRFDAITKNWYLEVMEEDIPLQTNQLNSLDLAYDIRDIGAVSFEKKNKQVPDKWGGHLFTEEEKATLEKGGKVYAEDFWSEKKQKRYSAVLTWDGNKISPRFSDKTTI